ncbi:putative spermidine/putrescine transport system permease protein [Microbacterium phyllosphaerae]|uniref:Spermidine/putrescine transport system permease protein n=1 Tax=Microbacterium phyllosphaerae TaxID=124798 RepID=A0ABS4WNN0_9MICO|nr:ABC transporter permease [Microbacterium phyllosphaerae]MBP2377807.1 putative spermidine/putrescine transport system permease protein [Microbacterium phyllosphaerae]MCS3442269.1 putative spermidine/putrescine transport system permease protein [Microbacterium phyllosphaerae]
MTIATAAGADASASAPVSPAAHSAGPANSSRAQRSAPSVAWLGLVPFAAYVLLFLAVPTVLAIGSGFFTKDGTFTWSNVSALGDPVVLNTFANSAGVSLLTAVIGAVVGALVCYALLGMNPDGAVRSTVDAAAGVLAQFGGVMLAFAFIATIGIQGVLKLFLQDTFGIDIFANGTWLYELPGLILPYIYFQIPLMVITFMPALAALKPQWAEANLTLGGTRSSFWLRIGIPVLAPSFLASLLLLFANAFSSYATAAALASQGAQIVPLQIRAALTSETVLGRENLAGALALGMIVIVGVVMALYSLVQRRAARWQS